MSWYGEEGEKKVEAAKWIGGSIIGTVIIFLITNLLIFGVSKCNQEEARKQALQEAEAEFNRAILTACDPFDQYTHVFSEKTQVELVFCATKDENSAKIVRLRRP